MDDGSKDETLAVARSFEARGVKVFSQPNGGASRARNMAFRYSKGDYIQYLDADDLLSVDKIETQLKLLAGLPEHLASCNTVFFKEAIDEGKVETGEAWNLFDSEDPVAYLVKMYSGEGEEGFIGMVSVHAWLTPRTLIERAGEWNETLSVNDDGEFFCRVVLASKGIRFCRRSIAYYRKHGGPSISRSKGTKAMRSALDAIELMEAHLLPLTDDKLARRGLLRLYMDFAVAAYPEFKALSAEAMQQIKRLGGGQRLPPMGSPALEWLARVFGWKVARLASHYKHLVKNRLRS